MMRSCISLSPSSFFATRLRVAAHVNGRSALYRSSPAAAKRRRSVSTADEERSPFVALVTGGSSGLGAGAARALAAAGAKVLVADLPHQEATWQAWNTLGNDRVSFCAMDVTDPKQVEHALDTLAERYAVVAPNLVVNCAGIGMARKTISTKPSESLSIRVHPLEEFSKTLHINAVGTFLVSSLAAERMCRQQQQSLSDADEENYCIVNTASIAAYEGQVGQVAYAASKGAIVGMTLPLARDLAPYRIRCMTIVRVECERFTDEIFILTVVYFCCSIHRHRGSLTLL
jgi:3-hydroxyacyl-CoA dehydrogenase / 3-hydroxy-2-methylbutyryl-CoA dehydrogenase